jgi:hypothetical protein
MPKSDEHADQPRQQHSGEAKAASGNGAEEPQQSPEATRIPPPPGRARIEELEAAIGGQGDGVILGEVEAEYESRQKLKPGEYIRAHRDKRLWQDALVLVDEDGLEKTTYLVARDLQPKLRDWLKRVLLVPAVNQDHEFFLWVIPIADISLGQRMSNTEKERRRAAEMAGNTWATVFWDGKRHKVRSADGNALGEPKWPKDLTRELINLRTFQDKYIGGINHPIAQYYLGLKRR